MILEIAIEPSLFREITTLIKTEKETYDGVIVELVESATRSAIEENK